MSRLKRLGVFICFIFSMHILLIPKTIQASVNIPSWVRIGLEYKYKNVSKIDIKNRALLMGYEMKGEFIPEAVLESNGGFFIMPSNLYFVGVNEHLDTYEEADELAWELKDLGFNAVPASLSYSKWTVYIGDFKSYEESEKSAAAVKDIIGKPFIIKEPSNTRTVLKNQYESLVVLEGEEAYPQFAGTDSATSEEIIDLGDRKYRGRMEFGRYSGSGMTAVNVILLKEYLYGVVPSEMYSAWPIEALKAQAVVARNYAMINMGKHKNGGYDLCDGQHCQAYSGYGLEASNSNLAVDETREELLFYGNEMITAVYFSSSGGYTEDSENVWLNPLPYLKAVPDPYEINSKIWTRSFSKEEVKVLLKNNGKDIGEVLDIETKSYTSSGRVKELKVLGTKGSEILTKENIRTFFKSNGTSLDSRMFEIIKGGYASSSAITVIGSSTSKAISGSQISVIGADKKIKSLSLENASINVLGKNGVNVVSFTSSTSISGDFVFQGKGYGHGVGMSQWGAKGMADQGYNYKQILSHYYTGTTVR